MVILEKRVPGLALTELVRFCQRAQTLARVSGEVSVLIAGNRRLKELNRRFRRKDRPTDVLSFPGDHGGDIAISLDMARASASRYGHDVSQELKVLVLHGMLHLAGYDHESDGGRMAARESRLRAQLGLPTSLIERSRGASTSPKSAEETVPQSPARRGRGQISGPAAPRRRKTGRGASRRSA